eukprot:TRINITY_DN18932_c0_g1_i1.p1 TRINITY_DN18932_c0_g1~~TRINITY_DN18932_c0_g1_i1.p1  ORF type:complete len:404 (-),score=75.67 TRINITY_DN18932_c0_g1_i1:174-1355(-)
MTRGASLLLAPSGHDGLAPAGDEADDWRTFGSFSAPRSSAPSLRSGFGSDGVSLGDFARAAPRCMRSNARAAAAFLDSGDAMVRGGRTRRCHSRSGVLDTQPDAMCPQRRVHKRAAAASAGSSFLFDGAPAAASTQQAGHPVESGREALIQWARSTPAPALVAMHVGAIVGAFPGSMAFELGEGYVYGFSRGFALAFAGKALGATATFWIARSAAELWGVRDWLEKRMDAWPTARALVAGAERGGHLFVFLMRLSPVPCFVNNYSVALLTNVPWSVYLPASFLGLVPMTAANVYAGTLAPPVDGLVAAGHGVGMGGAALQLCAAVGSVVAAGVISFAAGCALHGGLQAPCSLRRDAETSDEDGRAASEASAAASEACNDGAAAVKVQVKDVAG